MIDGVIFDMDGTIIDSKNALSGAVNLIRKDLFLPELDNDYILNIINDPNKDYAKLLFNSLCDGASFKAKYKNVYKQSYVENAKLFDGVLDIFEYLKSQNIKIMIATNALETTLEAILDSLDIKKYIHSYIGIKDGIKEKPDPQMIEILKVGFKKVIFVGDNDKDRLCANNANVGFLKACFVAKKTDDLICFDDFSSFKEGFLKLL